MLATFIATPSSANVIWDGNGSLVDKGYEEWGMPFSWDTESGVAHAGTAYQNFTTHIGRNYTAACRRRRIEQCQRLEGGMGRAAEHFIYTPGDFTCFFCGEQGAVFVPCFVPTGSMVQRWHGDLDLCHPFRNITTMVDMTSGYHKLGITVRQRYCMHVC